MKVGILEDLYRKNEEALEYREARIRFLERQLISLQKKNYPVKEMEAELRIHYPGLQSLAFGDMITNSADTLTHAIVSFDPIIYRKDRQKISEWLKLR